MQKHIIAIGGGGFSEKTEPGLDTYVLSQSSSSVPLIGFIGTASGDADSYLVKFYSRFSELDCQPSHLPLFRPTPDLEKWVAAQDVIYVGGGNTKSMLAVWRTYGLPDLLRQALSDGTILAGISAGAICWFEWGVTDSEGEELGPLQGLGYLPGSCCPHYAKEPQREPAFKEMIDESEIPDGVAIDDGAAIHYVDGEPRSVVIGRSGASAYIVRKTTRGTQSARYTSQNISIQRVF